MKTGLVPTVMALSLVLMASKQSASHDLSSPQATTRSFMEAISRNDYTEAAACLEKSAPPEAGKAFFKDWPRAGVEIKTLFAEVEADTAHVAVEGVLSFPQQEDLMPYRFADMISLRKIGDEWKIVAAPEAMERLVKQRGMSLARPLYFLSSILSDTEVLRAAQSEVQRNVCLSNGSTVGTALLMYSQDWDERLPPKGTAFREVIKPYITKKGSFFHCPQEPEGSLSYSMNPYLFTSKGIADKLSKI